MPDGTFDITGPVVALSGVTEPYSAPYVRCFLYLDTDTTLWYSCDAAVWHASLYPGYYALTAAGTCQLICSMEHDLLDCVGADTLIIQTAPLLTLEWSCLCMRWIYCVL